MYLVEARVPANCLRLRFRNLISLLSYVSVKYKMGIKFADEIIELWTANIPTKAAHGILRLVFGRKIQELIRFETRQIFFGGATSAHCIL